MRVQNRFNRAAWNLLSLVRQFAAGTRGNVAMIFALTMPVLVMITMGGVDINRASTVRSSLQDSLDTATLAVARSSATTEEEINAIGNQALRANLQDFPDATLTSATFTLDESQTVVSDAIISVRTLVAGLVLPSGQTLKDRIQVNAHSEVNRSSKNLEVSMVLDVTGSMNGNDVASLKTAAASLVDVIVKTQQTPYTSRVAIVPYSMGVNLGALAVKARGAVAIGSPITHATRSCSTSKKVTTCTIVVTSSGHPYAVGDRVVISGLNGMNGALNSPNDTAWTITARTANTFTFKTGSVSGSYTSGGMAYCTAVGCEYRAFTNMDGGISVHRISTCVTERTGAQAYTDAAPSTASVGLNYPTWSSDNACLSSQLMPLSSDRAALKARINALTAVGSTAGHIGTAWGWYTVSPSFNNLWSASAANPYNATETVKAVVLMTDGDFNTPYHNGVIAGDALNGSGANSRKINQAAVNGPSAAQAARLCTAMKAQGVTVYTVAFSVADNSAAATLLNGCASSSNKAFSASSGAQLVSAFQAIGRDITQLRISR